MLGAQVASMTDVKMQMETGSQPWTNESLGARGRLTLFAVVYRTSKRSGTMLGIGTEGHSRFRDLPA